MATFILVVVALLYISLVLAPFPPRKGRKDK